MAEFNGKVAHFSEFARRGSGLFEATRDQIKAERRAGLNSYFIDHRVEDPESYQEKTGFVLEDEGIEVSPWAIAEECDVWVLHRKIPEELEPLRKDKISVAVLHGASEHMIFDEVVSDAERGSFNLHIALLWDYSATVALNSRDFQILKYYDQGDKLVLIHDAIDVERYAMEGWKQEFIGEPAIISTDMVRSNKEPSSLLWAMPLVRERLPHARLILCALPMRSVVTWRNLIYRAPDPEIRNSIEMSAVSLPDLRPYMRGAHIGFNNNISGIPSRATMEQMALGVTTLSYNGAFTKYHPRVMNLESIAETIEHCWNDISQDLPGAREQARAYAESYFNIEKAVEEYIKLYEGLCEGRAVQDIGVRYGD